MIGNFDFEEVCGRKNQARWMETGWKKLSNDG